MAVGSGNRKEMLPGGALMISIVLAFVMGILISFFIILSLHFRLQAQSDILQERLESNLNSAFELVSSGYITSSVNLDLYGEGTDSVRIKMQSWGMLDVATIEAYGSGKQISKSALLGQVMNPELVLQIANNIDVLKVSGRSRIQGTSIVPYGKIEAGIVNGIGPAWADYQKGGLEKAGPMVPECVLGSRLPEYFSGAVSGPLLRIQPRDTLVADFKDSIKILEFENTVSLSKGIFRNKVLIRSAQEIRIERGVSLQNVILVAPVIRFRQGANVCVQAFATDSLIVEEGAFISYPSVLAVGRIQETQRPRMRINSGTVVEGLVCSWQKEAIQDYIKPYICVKEGASIVGLVAGDDVEFSGKLKGTLIAKKIVGRKNQTIENAELSAMGQFFITPVWNEVKRRAVCVWIPGQ